jgi:hypothetical protein
VSLEAARALRRTLELVESSQSSLWANDEVETISQHLRAAISALESGAPVDLELLSVLFAPTGDIQETSLASGWGDEFLSLARAIDAFLHTSS